MVLQRSRSDILVLDKADRSVAVVNVSATEDAGAEAQAQLQEYLGQSGESVAYAIFADLSIVRIFRVDGCRVEDAPAATLSTQEIAAEYDANFASKRIFHEYLAEIMNAWISDIAYHWKSANPPGQDVLTSIGLAQLLLDGSTVREFALDMILYIETNLIIAAAKGQDARIFDLWNLQNRGLRLVIPSVCVMEALSAFDAERKARKRFTNELQTQITQARRDTTSRNAAFLLTALQEARVANTELLNDIESRLVFVLERLSGLHSGHPTAEFIALQPEVLRDTLDQSPSAMLNPTDALILQTIVAHARQDGDPTKAMLTGNTNDFATPEARAAMTQANIEHFFPNAEALLGWLRGHTDVIS